MDKETIKLNEQAIKKAIAGIKNTYSPDKMIIQAVQALNEEETSINTEYERLREMYWRYYPEKIEMVDNVGQLINTMSKEVKVPATSMGYFLNKDELAMMKDYASVVEKHLEAIKVLEAFIKIETRKITPNTSKICSPLITAKLITLAGGFKNIALMPASTIQLLGAEKALFRHLRSKARPPKHGIILHHQKVQAAKNKGKAARQLANKLMITLRQDYFGGKI